MASLFHKVARFARSPQGRRMIGEAKRRATDPKTKQQAKDTIAKLRGKGKGTGGTPPSPGH